MSARQVKSQKEQDLTSRHAPAGLISVVGDTNYGKVIMSLSCKLCPSTELVYSGTASLLLGVPTETYCYPCANQLAIMRSMDDSEAEVSIIGVSEFKFIHCPECDYANGHYPDCESLNKKENTNA